MWRLICATIDDAHATVLPTMGLPTTQALKLDGQMRELAASLKDEPSMLVFGRGQNYATALETALKVGLKVFTS
jgi:glucosamine 6-phosphate synthetase-like amidotransferase/phosphosugar isomerase protein